MPIKIESTNALFGLFFLKFDLVIGDIELCSSSTRVGDLKMKLQQKKKRFLLQLNSYQIQVSHITAPLTGPLMGLRSRIWAAAFTTAGPSMQPETKP